MSIITIAGNTTDQPELRYTPNGIPVATFAVAVNKRVPDGQGGFKDGETSFFDVEVWREAAENAAASLSKGDRVVVQGEMRQKRYQDRDGKTRSTYFIAASDVAASTRYARMVITKQHTGSNTPPAYEDMSGDTPF